MSADDATIRRAKSGDAGAWQELYRAHAGRLVVWLRTLPTGDASVSADDLAAEAWLTAAKKISTFFGSSSEFAGWLFGIARNLARNTWRRSVRRATDPVGYAPTTRVTTIGAHEAVDGQAWVSWVLSHLPDREREVLSCIEVVGLDVAATALALGMSPTAVRVARHRGLRRLRSLGSRAVGQQLLT